MDEIKVLIADDHAIVRMGLVALLESDEAIRVVGEAEDGGIAVRKAIKLKPGIVIMDILMPEMDGIDATRQIKEKLPETKVLILTTSTVSDDLARVLEAGADGIVTKSTANTKLLAAIHAVASGRRVVPPKIAELIANDPPVKPLTDRQLDILASITRGLSNADIAKQLCIREDSVREHLDAIYTKLNAANRSEAIGIALRKHLLKI